MPDAVTSPNSGEGWLEVGPKQKASTTRTAGQDDAPSPVTKIFGGYLRSELRVTGMKDSVTREPYQPLQLDIGAANVNNIVDALRGLTRTEILTGDFGGKAGTTAKKQVFIDTLPPVLILHLKRFQYDSNLTGTQKIWKKRFQYDSNLTGTQKIWKKVGYPLELEIPKEAFPPVKRGSFAVQGGLPKYRLISVVYHHGKSAAGGHYTVDVLRADGREWVRMDDTVIRRVRPDDVAEGGAEEDPKVLAKALEQHKADQDLQKQRNMYQGLDEADKEPEEEKPWSEVNGHIAGKKWNASVAATNGTATPASAAGKRTPTMKKDGVKDSKETVEDVPTAINVVRSWSAVRNASRAGRGNQEWSTVRRNGCGTFCTGCCALMEGAIETHPGRRSGHRNPDTTSRVLLVLRVRLYTTIVTISSDPYRSRVRTGDQGKTPCRYGVV
nr:putative ubiquitin carboxyl-terminal hydrolase 3 [Quercus suber]